MEEIIPPVWKLVAFFAIAMYLFLVYGSTKRYRWNQVRIRFGIGLVAIFVILRFEDVWAFLLSPL